MKPQKTDWINGSVLPVRRGWYEAHGLWCEGGGDRKSIAMRYWNGKRWMWKDIYQGGRLVGAAVGSDDTWRGIVGPNAK
jgi:hypothetical protein